MEIVPVHCYVNHSATLHLRSAEACGEQCLKTKCGRANWAFSRACINHECTLLSGSPRVLLNGATEACLGTLSAVQRATHSPVLVQGRFLQLRMLITKSSYSAATATL
eukprot:3372722-Amphidinium_carterae.2